MIIYKVLQDSEWAALVQNGETTGAPIDVADGYIHFSTAEQVRETVTKHFGGSPDLILASVEADTLGEALKWEISRGGAKFPHLYRKLRRSDIVHHEILPAKGESHVFADDIP